MKVCLTYGALTLGIMGAAVPAWAQVEGGFRIMADSIPNVYFGEMAWGDVDQDGDFDVAISGGETAGTTTLHINAGDVIWQTQAGSIFGTDYDFPYNQGGILDPRPENPLRPSGISKVAWIDYNGDGSLDLVTNGLNDAGVPEVTLYEYVGGAVHLALDSRLPGTFFGGMDWGDYDNDGDPDLALSGKDETGADATFLYEYQREIGGGFVRRDPGLTALAYGSVDWGDYDRDGDLDLLVSGIQAQPQAFLVKVYRNDGNGAFVDIGARFDALAFATAAWGDYDADGDLDVVLSGGKLSPFLLRGTLRVFQNTGGSFSSIGVDAPGGFQGGVMWGDYDADGRLDVASVGGSGPVTVNRLQIIRNLGHDFAPIGDFAGVAYGDVTWGDYDNDGDLDLYMVGRSTTGLPLSQQFRNELNPGNQPPAEPQNLHARREGDDVIFSWDAVTDDFTPTAGLTYNLQVGLDPGTHDVLSAMARPDGNRLIADFGNVGHRLSWRLRMPEGVYYWSVQAIDGSYRGGPFGEEQIIISGDPNDEIPPAPPQRLEVLPGDGQVFLSWAENEEEDLARYRLYRSTAPGTGERLVSITAGTRITYLDDRVQNGTVYYYRLTAVDISGNESAFSEEAAADPLPLLAEVDPGLPRGTDISAAWGDYDADGNMDLLVAGNAQFRFNDIYRNEGDTLININARQPIIVGGTHAWSDYDGDGDLDYAFTGNVNFTSPSTRVQRNDDGQFVRAASGVDLPGVAFGRIMWGDYDTDGDLDLLVQGRTNNLPLTAVIRNEGDNTFMNADAALPGVFSGDAVWADYDNDGDLDVAVAGQSAADGSFLTRVYAYNNSQFEQGTSYASVSNASLAWADFDGNGRLDLMVSGFTALNANTRVYYDDGNATATGLPPAAVQMHPGDFNNDGRIDVATSGSGGIRIYLNLGRSFVNSGIFIPDSENAAFAWLDWDGDLDLDLAVIRSFRSRIYLNNTRPFNTSPGVPAGLNTTVTEAGVALNWEAAHDAQTSHLTYNVRVGTTPGGQEVVAAMSLPDGTRQVAAAGNAGHALARPLSLLPPGTYYWSVQAVDHSFVGSAFAPEQTFTVGASISPGTEAPAP